MFGLGRFAGVLSVTVIAALAAAPSAGAAIATSQISSPANPSFALWNSNEPNSIEVAGTASGGSPGDRVDIDCYTGSEVRVLEGGVPVAGNGSFLVPAVSLEAAAAHGCRLRAVPAGTTPADPTPFAGPLLAVGRRRLNATTVGAELNRPYDFLLEDRQLGAGGAYRSIGGCGGGFLNDSALETTTSTFFCASRLWRFDDYDEPGTSTRSQIQVDGADAYTAATVNEIWGGAEHFPAISFSAFQDPATGNVVVHDNETFDTCPSLTYPGTSSTCFAPSGVRDERLIEQSEDGHLFTIIDRYSSTDGQAHQLDLLPENVQRFAPTGGKHAPAIAYRFPGEPTFSTHVSGDVVPFAGATPGAVLVHVEGFPDGDQGTGQGAIVFDRPASPATFNLLENEEFSGFEFHQAATVPASGSTAFRTAYVQAYTSAEVEALVAKVEAAFSPAPPAPAPPAPPAGRSTPAPTIEVLKAKLDKRRGTATLLVQVSGPGRLVLSGKDVAKATGASHSAAVVKLAVRARGRARVRLNHRGRAKVGLTVTFAPAEGGAAVSATRSLTLKRALGRRAQR
jgi:hypothetical protein